MQTLTKAPAKVIVLVKPVPTKKWHGKDGKDSFSRPQSFDVLYDSSTGGYATGLTEEEEREYGKKMGVDLSNKFHQEEPHDYWGTTAARIKLPNHTMAFNLAIASDYVKVKNMKASKLVANSLQEWEAGKWPEATHIIYDEAQEVDLKASKIQNYQKCLVILSKMSTDEKTNMMALLSDKSSSGRSNNFVDVELNSLLSSVENPQGADAKIEEFLRYAKMDAAESTTRAQILEGIHKGVITKEGHSHYYMGEKLGHDFEATVAYFMEPNNQQIKIAILEKITA